MTVEDLIRRLMELDEDTPVFPSVNGNYCGWDGYVTVEEGQADRDDCKPFDAVFISGTSKE